MTEENKIKILITDGVDAKSIAEILTSKGFECEIINNEETQIPNDIPVLRNMTLPELNSFEIDNECWWKKFYGKGRKAPRY